MLSQTLQTLVVGLVAAAGVATALPAANIPPPHHGFKIVKTTTNSYGQVIDWVMRDSQGTVAQPPPESFLGSAAHSKRKALQELVAQPRYQGPPGTVPIVRNLRLPAKVLAPHLDRNNETSSLAARAGNPHWYAYAIQDVANHGGVADFNIFNPAVQDSQDFSLVQTAIARTGASCTDGSSGVQTVEAGWMHYGLIADTYDPSKDQQSFLFTFFNTNGYRKQADYLGGYPSYYKGWVQYDSDVHPGYFFSPVSTIGGTQKELTIGYTLYKDNWWCSVGGKFIGYYPASLFSKNSSNPSNTLAAGANEISFYGEVTNGLSTYTTSDMGSGNYPDQGYGKAAYIRNIQYYNTDGAAVNFNTNAIKADEARGYKVQTFFNSGKTGWNSYMYLGGPGGDGKIGA